MEKNELLNNFQIVYSNADLHKTSISGLEEEDISKCIAVIKESNPDIDINLIQYSRDSRRITFYAIKPIITSKWEANLPHTQKSIMTSTGVLEEIKKLIEPVEQIEETMVSLDDNDSIISLSEVLKLLRFTYKQHNSLKDKYEEEATSKYRTSSTDSSHVYIRDYDYSKEKLQVAFSPYSFSNWIYYYFYKKDNDLISQKEENGRSEDKGVVATSETILKYMNELEQYRGFNTQKSVNIPTINSRFIVKIDRYGIELSTPTRYFSLDAKSYKDEYDYECNSNNIATVIKNNENLIYDKTLVRIKDCPEWMHADLYRIRKESVAKEKKKKDEQNKMEEQRQKRIELKNRFFPFLRNRKNG